jgi:hypothetical protein
MIQSREGDWIINLIPPGIDFRLCNPLRDRSVLLFIKAMRLVVCPGISPGQTKTSFSVSSVPLW